MSYRAPDYFVPLIAFFTYVILADLTTLSLHGKISPETLLWLFLKGLFGWACQFALLEIQLLYYLGGAAPLLVDVVAYTGYTFTGVCVAMIGKLILPEGYLALETPIAMYMGIFLVFIIKSVLRSIDMRVYYESHKHWFFGVFTLLGQLVLLDWLVD